jgi:hypothetical protein
MGVSGWLHKLVTSAVRKEPPSTHLTGNWVGTRAAPDITQKRKTFTPTGNQTTIPWFSSLYPLLETKLTFLLIFTSLFNFSQSLEV